MRQPFLALCSGAQIGRPCRGNQGIGDRRRCPGPELVIDSKADPIVRVEAGRLRDRLNSYYEAEGEADPVLISLPKGGYVPELVPGPAGHRV